MKLITTVEHSAFRELVQQTNLYVVELKFENEDCCAWHRDTGEKREDAWLYAHLTDENMPMILDAAKRMPSVTITRPLADVQASWIKRRKDLADLDRQLANYDKFVAEAAPLVLDVAEGMDACVAKLLAAFHDQAIWRTWYKVAPAKDDA